MRSLRCGKNSVLTTAQDLFVFTAVAAEAFAFARHTFSQISSFSVVPSAATMSRLCRDLSQVFSFPPSLCLARRSGSLPVQPLLDRATSSKHRKFGFPLRRSRHR